MRLRSLFSLRPLGILSLVATLALALGMIPAVSGGAIAHAQPGGDPSITTTSLPDGTVGVSYSADVNVFGSLPPWTLTDVCGSLPPGLTLNGANIATLVPGGTITGTPTAPGTYSFTLQITDIIGNTEQQPLSITINPAQGSATPAVTTASVLAHGGPSITEAPAQPGGDPSITTTSLPDGTVGVSYSADVNVFGSLPPWTLTDVCGSLPPGLTLNGANIATLVPGGTITGTPTAPGTYSFTLQITDIIGNTEQQPLSITVNPAAVSPPTITTTSLPAGTVGTAYSQALAASNGTRPYTWSLVAPTSLPPGLSLDPGSGMITGSPTTQGSYDFTVRVTDADGKTATQPLSIQVNAAATGTACTTTITGTHATALTVTSGITCLAGATQHGGITVDAGAGLIVTNSTVNGTVTATSASVFEYCGSTQSGTMTVTGTTGAVTLGDGGSCAADTSPSLVTVSGTGGAVTISRLKENGTLTLSGNAGGVTLNGITLSGLAYVQDNVGTAPVTVAGNTINGSLYCTGNTPPPGDGGTVNTVTGSATGQCSGLAER